MTRRPCISCGTLTQGTRCTTCQASKERLRNQAAKHRDIVLAASACAACGQPPTPGDPLVVDHHLALAHGGGSELANLRALHQSCNTAKGAN